MSQHLGVDKIESIFAVHYETMDQDKGHKKISLIKERKTLEKIKSGLDGLSSQGTVSKLWRADVPTVRVFILCETGKYAVMDIVNHRIARVGGNGSPNQIKSAPSALSVAKENLPCLLVNHCLWLLIAS